MHVRPQVLRAEENRWPLVGRQEELGRIADSIRAGARSAIVVAGVAGVGKTRLAVEALDAARAAEHGTVWITATRSAAAIPFGAFAQLLPADLAAAETPLDLFRVAREALTDDALERAYVLVVDDAHLLDAPSAALVHQLVATRGAFVLVTVRSGEPAPDAITALWKDGLCDHLEPPAAVPGAERRAARSSAERRPRRGDRARPLADRTRPRAVPARARAGRARARSADAHRARRVAVAQSATR